MDNLTPEQKVALGEAPMKAEFSRRLDARRTIDTLRSPPHATGIDSTTATDNATASEQPQKKGKNALKRERGAQRYSTKELCGLFVRGQCRFDNCKFNHDVAAYLPHRTADLPGKCPFDVGPDPCPFGITCRWATAHTNPDELCRKYLQSNTGGGGEGTAHLIGEDDDNKPSNAPSNNNTDSTTTTSFEWWRHDGTIPLEGHIFTLPRPAELKQTVNSLEKSLQTSLRKSQYDFTRADDILAKLGINNTSKARERKNDKSRQQQQQKGGKNNNSMRGGGGNEDEEQAAKKQKISNGANEGVTTTAADASFINGIGESAAEAPQQQQNTSQTPKDGEQAEYVEVPLKPAEKPKIDFTDKLFLAPLTTVGNLPFRRVCKTMGADVTCGEMALAVNLLQGQASEWALLKRHPDEDFFGVQVCGGFGDAMTRCAQLIEDKCEVDFVDINFGCPIDLVCGKGAGSACLQRPQRMADIIKGMSSILTCPLTLKMRKGYMDGNDIAHTLVPKVAEWGAAAVTLHGRTREQRYSKLADWPYIKTCADAAKEAGIQLVGNGDVFGFEDHYNHLANEGVNTTYIARGALIKPWIFTEIKEKRHWDITASERLDIFKKFASFGLEHWGSDGRGVETTRRFLLEWMSFTHRYIPVGLLEVLPQGMNWRPPAFVGRNDLETLLSSPDPADWVAVSEMLLGRAPDGFQFTPKHKATSYVQPRRDNGQGQRGGGGGAKAAAEEQENG